MECNDRIKRWATNFGWVEGVGVGDDDIEFELAPLVGSLGGSEDLALEVQNVVLNHLQLYQLLWLQRKRKY